jgi:4-aminobutyrate aminotransferase-like enzyme/Ser/Thr protein kinase RdoA (MazF antagonist)
MKYLSIKITEYEAAKIAQDFYNIRGEIIPLDGELDFNFRIDTGENKYILKISRPKVDADYIDFQNDILHHISDSGESINSPKIIPSVRGDYVCKVTDNKGNMRFVRLLSWIDGRLWSSVNPVSNELLFNLGAQAGLLTKTLQGFDHKSAHRSLDWDIARSEWVREYVSLFENNHQNLVLYYLDGFEKIQDQYISLRKAVIHNDANDNNIIISNNLHSPEINAIIDYGDAVYTQIINDLAVTIAYAVMNKADVLAASLHVVKGYHSKFPITEEEIDVLYFLVAIRLVISVTKSAINRQSEPDNKYLLISEKPAWDVLEKWMTINQNLACYSFRSICGYTAHPNEEVFKNWIKNHTISVNTLIQGKNYTSAFSPDFSIESNWLGHQSEYNDSEKLAHKIQQLHNQNPDSVIAGGYLEIRPLYSTEAFKKESNNGPCYRTMHLGTDFWFEALTPIHAPFDGEVICIYNNSASKDYGPTLILEHRMKEFSFYTLYGHLSKSTMDLQQNGKRVRKGDLIGYIGNSQENGTWAPHLHFQIMLDLLGESHNFPGVAFPDDIKIWQSICPDPGLVFKELPTNKEVGYEESDILLYRKKHLGKSLSIAYENPLHIVRGEGAFLIDRNGQKYLDTVNNVAHVGHEHPRVVKTAQEQIAVLNTNTRYLHENINIFAEELLATFPDELCVVHVVNSGSEANELALRMVSSDTGQKDMIAIEVGYHGNTSGCVDISSYKFDGKGGKGAPEFTHIVPLPDSYRGIYQGTESGNKYSAHVLEQIKKIHNMGRNVAGFMCESIMSCGGQIELPENYLKFAYEAIRKSGGLCIADEVQVGCGRVGSHFWGFQLHNVIPDIVTIGKPIGNGHPLAAVVCTREVADAFANGMEYFNTFGGNPVSCAIGSSVLQVIKDEKLQENALEVGEYLKSGLQELQNDFPIIGDVRGQGFFLGFELADKQKTPLTGKATYLANRMRQLGILMSTDGRDNNVLKIKPPMVFSKQNSDELLERLRTVFNEDYMKF